MSKTRLFNTDLPDEFIRKLIQPTDGDRSAMIERMSKALELLNQDVGRMHKIHPAQWTTYDLDKIVAAQTNILISLKNYQDQILRCGNGA